MFKVAYSYGLRINELRHLQTVDFSRNAHAGEFGRYGVVQVRYGKAKKGSPPKRRGVLTVFKWTAEVITDWLAHGRACMSDGLDLFPSERGALVAENTLLRRFVATVGILSCQTDWICTRCAARTLPTS
jgi:site-specific recombinase XerC